MDMFSIDDYSDLYYCDDPVTALVTLGVHLIALTAIAGAKHLYDNWHEKKRKKM